MRSSKLLGFLAAGAVVGTITAVLVERVVAYKVRQITHPARDIERPMVTATGQPIPQVTFPTTDGLTLTGWYLPTRNGATVIVQHGYSANSSQTLTRGLMLAEQGFGVLWFDFRAHGRSAGDLVTLGLHEVRDTEAALAFLHTRPEVDPACIGILGLSMGGATAILAAARNPQLRAVAVECAFAELKEEVGIGITVKTPLPTWPFANIFVWLAQWQTGFQFEHMAPVRVIGQISPRPLFIIHGGADARIAPDSGPRLYAAANEPKTYWYLPDVAHVAVYEAAPAEYAAKVIPFFEQALGVKSGLVPTQSSGG